MKSYILPVLVTDRHLHKGKRNHRTDGPVNRAIREAVSDTFKCECNVEIITGDYVFINGRIFPLPHSIQKLIEAHDRNKYTVPVNFTLELSDDVFRSEKPGRS